MGASHCETPPGLGDNYIFGAALPVEPVFPVAPLAPLFLPAALPVEPVAPLAILPPFLLPVEPVEPVAPVAPVSAARPMVIDRTATAVKYTSDFFMKISSTDWLFVAGTVPTLSPTRETS